MSIGILSAHAPLNHWLTQVLPDLQVWEQVEEGLLQCEKIFLLPSYEVGDETYQILDLWTNYLGIRNPDYHLVLLGYEYLPTHSNYLSIPRPPQNLKHWLTQTQSIQDLFTPVASHKSSETEPTVFQEPTPFPPLSDKQLADELSGILTSHGYTFHSALIDTYSGMRQMSWQVAQQGILPEKLWAHPSFIDFQKAYYTAKGLWEYAQPYFSLLPSFPNIQAIEQQFQALEQLIRQNEATQTQLTSLATCLSFYLTDTILEVTEIYSLHKEESSPTSISGHRRGKILVIDDEAKWYEDIAFGVKGHTIFHADSRPKAHHLLEKGDIDLVILDLDLKGKKDASTTKGVEKAIFMSIDRSLDYVGELKEKYPNLRVIVLSKHYETDRVLMAGRNGADDYLYKEVFNPNTPDFRKKINRLIQEKRALQSVQDSIETKLWGDSVEVRKLQQQLIELTVQRSLYGSFLLQGEAGCGKENAVKHLASLRTKQEEKAIPLVQVQAELWEQEAEEVMATLQGANGKSSNNFLHKARGGILYVRQIEHAPKHLQKALFQLIDQQHYLSPDWKTYDLNVQVVIGSTLGSEELFASQRVAEILLNQLPLLHIPALRDRRDDIPVIITQWLELNGFPPNHISQKLQDSFQNHDYPYNVFELLKMLEESLAHHRGIHLQEAPTTPVGPESLPNQLWKGKAFGDFDYEVARVELDFIDRALAAFGGDKDKAAQALGGRNSDHLRHFIKMHKKRFPGLLKQFSHIQAAYFGKK